MYRENTTYSRKYEPRLLYMYYVQPHFKKQLFPASSSCGSTDVSIIASPYWRRGEVPGFL